MATIYVIAEGPSVNINAGGVYVIQISYRMAHGCEFVRVLRM